MKKNIFLSLLLSLFFYNIANGAINLQSIGTSGPCNHCNFYEGYNADIFLSYLVTLSIFLGIYLTYNIKIKEKKVKIILSILFFLLLPNIIGALIDYFIYN